MNDGFLPEHQPNMSDVAVITLKILRIVKSKTHKNVKKGLKKWIFI